MTGIGYASVNAKIRYWLSYLLKAEDADFLSRASMNEIIDFIRKHELKSSIDSNNLTDVESAVKQAIVDYVKSGVRFLSGGSRAFIEEWMKVYEIEDLKIIARAIVGKRPVDFLYRLQYNSRFNLEAVKSIQTLDEYQEFLRGTKYYSIASYTFPRVKEENNTFYWEMMLDNQYALNLKEMSKSLNKTDGDAAKNLIFFSLEMNRIIWLYRMRFHYKYPMEETLSYVPNIFGVFNSSRYTELVESANEAEFIKRLIEWKIIKAENAEYKDLERFLNMEIQRRATKYRKTAPFSLALFLSFIVLKSMTVRSFIVLLEGKRHNIDPNLIRSMIAV